MTLSDQLFYTSFQNIGILQIRETMGMTRSKEMEDLNYEFYLDELKSILVFTVATTAFLNQLNY